MNPLSKEYNLPFHFRGLIRRRLVWLLSRKCRVLTDVWYAVSPTQFGQLYPMVRPYTMCSAVRLLGLYRAVIHVLSHGIPGDLVECGTARGGSAALMGLSLNRLGASRILWVFDTFEGLPPPTDGDPDREIAEQCTGGCRGDIEQVKAFFDSVGILAQCKLVKGLFQDTLPTCNVKAIAVLHIDSDWYESVKACLDHFYDRVSPGGVIQIDDYGYWEGARRAVDEFLGRRSGHLRLRRLDYAGRQLVKP